MVAPAGPFTGDEPDFVVKQPFCGPGQNRGGKQHVVLPFAAVVEAEFIAWVYVGQTVVAGMQCEFGLDDVDAGTVVVPVLDSGTVGLACRGGLDWHDAIELTAVDFSAAGWGH